MTRRFVSTDDALRKAGELHPATIDLSLGRILRLLHDLDRPQDRLPPAFHVAGTNGKGSTVAFISARLEAAGYSVHAYTSPHLKRFNERIRLGRPGGGSDIVDDDRLIEAMERCHRVNAGQRITFFEITTAAAMLLFSEHPADALVCEVGLGGRFDATNVLGNVDVSVITPVDLDHREFLGDDHATIAREKAGICRTNRPLVVSRQHPDAFDSITKEARRLMTPIHAFGRQWNAWMEGGRLVYQENETLLDLPPPRRLIGRHQAENAGAAVAAVRRGHHLSVSDGAIAEGVEHAFWPGRLQRLDRGPFYDAATRGGASEVWADGAHNPHGARSLAEWLADMNARDPKDVVMVAAILITKDAAGFFDAFRGIVRTVRTAPVPKTEAGFTPEEAAAVASRAGVDAQSCDSLEQAALLGAASAPGCRLILAGSLYAIGAALPDDAIS